MMVPAWARALHGTEARARRHWRDGEKPCPACAEAHRQAKRRRDAAKRREVKP